MKVCLKKIVLLLLIFSSFIQASNLEKVTLQLKWKYQFQFAGFIMAKEKGFYNKVGLDVEIKEFDTNIDITKDVENKVADFGISDSALIYNALRGENVVGLMPIFQQSAFILMGLKSNSIKTIHDIDSKTLAIYSGLDGISIQTMLKSNNINYIEKPPAFTLDKLISGEVDMMSAYVANEPYQMKIKNIETITFAPQDYGFEGYGDILFTSKYMLDKEPKVVHNFYTASKKGWDYAFSHIDETVELIYKKYNSLNKSKDALTYEANKLKELSGYGDNFGEFDYEKIKSIAQLFNLMRGENNSLSNLSNFAYKPIQNLKLTQEELEYIKSKKTIKVCVHPNQFPFVIFDEKKGGISVEYLKNIEKQTGLKYKFIVAKTHKEHLEMLKNGLCDVVPAIVRYPNKFKFLEPTQTILEDNIVLATKINEPYLNDFDNIGNKKIGIQKGTKNLQKYVKSIYPNLNLIEVDRYDMNKILDNELYGYIGPSYQMSYMIFNDYFNKIKIMSKIGNRKLDGSFGVTNREPILLSILNKSIENIDSMQIAKIKNSWRSIKVEKSFDYSLFWKIFGLLLAIIFAISFFYIKQKRLHVKIKEEKEKFKNIFDKSSDGISIMSNGVFTECNEALVNLLGYSTKEQIINLNPSQLSPEFQEDGQKSFDKSMLMIDMALKNGVHHFEWIHLKENGDKFWADIVLTDISTHKDEKIIHAVWRDIQYKKELENELIQLNRDLEKRVTNALEKNKQQQLLMIQQNRLAQMGEMISMIAHQWRQPLNALSIIIQSIVLRYERGNVNSEHMESFYDKSKTLIKQMSETINDFRDFFKPEKNKVEFCVNDAILESIKIIEPIYVKNSIELNFKEILNEKIYYVGYPNELGQALLNIINNAKDALIDKNRESKFVEVALEKSDEMITISISDNAGGIEDEVMDRMYDPYFSTKDAKNGTGLGLYMTKLIIEDHMNGELSASNTDIGVEFKIIFKLS